METSVNAIATNLITNPAGYLPKITVFQGELAKEADEQRAKLNGLRAASREALYERLGSAWDLISDLTATVSPEAQIALLKLHGLEPARPGYNEFGPFNTMLWGRWIPLKDGAKAPADAAIALIDGKTCYFKPNRSAEKYAKAMRYAFTHRLTGVQLTKKLNDLKLDGVVEADSKATAKTDQYVIEVDKLRKAVLDEAPRGKPISRAEVGIPEEHGGKYACVWGTFDTSGNFVARGIYPAADKTIEGHVDKLASKIGKDLLIRRLERENAAQLTQPE